MIPAGFTDVGVNMPLLVSGWLALGLLVIGGLIAWASDWFEADVGVFIGGMLAFFGGLVGVAWLVLLFPYQSEYHHVYRVSGTVESVSNVVSEASGDLTRTPVVELSGIDRPIVVDDPRITGQAGSDVELTCRIGWHYQAADTYSCEIYSIEANR